MDNQILTIEEVADYLRVSERTVYDWAQKGVLPAGKFGTAWRFKRKDIESWVDKKLNKTSHLADTHTVALENLLSPHRVLNLKGKTKREALMELIDVLGDTPQVTNREELEEAIFRREELMSTGIGMGMAIPHVRITSVKDLVMAVGISKPGINDYQSLDNEPIRLIIMIAAGEGQHAYYLKALSFVSAKLKEEKNRKAIIGSVNTDQAYRLIVGQEV